MRQQSGKEPVTEICQGSGNEDAAWRIDMHALAGLGEGQPPLRRAVAGQTETDRPAVDGSDQQQPLFESHFRDGDLGEPDSVNARATDDTPPVLPENDDLSSIKDDLDETDMVAVPGVGDDHETGGVLRDASANMALTDPQEVREERLPDGAVLSAEAVHVPAPMGGSRMAGEGHETLHDVIPVRSGDDAGPVDAGQRPSAVSQDTFIGDLAPARAGTSLIATNPATAAPQLVLATGDQGRTTATVEIGPDLPSARNAASPSGLLNGQPVQSGAVLAALPLVATASHVPDAVMAGRVPERATVERVRAGDMTRVLPEMPGGLRAVGGRNATAAALPVMPFMPEGAALHGVPRFAEDDIPAYSGPRAPAVYALGLAQVGAAALPAQPHHVVMQIAAAIGRGASGADRVIDLVLSPEELGKVRLSLSQSDAGLSVSVLAERPETLDLLRRNIDLLAGEFLDIGYQSAEFSFGHEEPGAQQHPRATVSSPGPLSEDEGDTAYLASALHLGDRLDIRL